MSDNVKQAQIEYLEFPECVRKRKGMYISNLNQMVSEIVDNSIDEYTAGFCNMIAVAIVNGTITVEDNGRGIPVTASKKDPTMPQVELAFTTLHAGGKFGASDGYEKKTTGMNGVGGSCVQALSDSMTIQVQTGGNKYEIQFSKGVTTNKLRLVEEGIDAEESGTSVTFVPDKEIWVDDKLDLKKIKKRLHQLAYLNPGLQFYMYLDSEEKDGSHVKLEENICYPQGLVSYVDKLTAKKVKIVNTIGASITVDDIDVQIAMTYTDGYNEEIYTFCNNVATVDNGDHLLGYKLGLTKSLKDYAQAYNLEADFESDDSREGLIAIVSIKVGDPNFEGQSKSKLKMNNVRAAVKQVTEQMLQDYLDKNPEEAKVIFNKILQAAKARKAAQKARENSRKSKDLIEGGLPGKIAECQSKDPEECEIYLVEGDSAAGSAKQGRDRRIQSILPVFGKILNVERKRLNDVINNPKLQDVLKALKCGIDKDFNIEKIRYHKIIIMADADVDGSHIACLWITFFYRFLRPLIDAGYLYIACPPLFKLTYNRKIEGYAYDKEEKATIIYAYDDEENTKYINELGQPNNTQRYKGLGEMMATQLWDTTMNPENRKLIQVTIDDAESCEEMISICMSEEVEPRRDYIMEYSEFADLDI